MSTVRGLITLGYYFGLMPVGAAWMVGMCNTRGSAQAVIRQRANRALRLGGLEARVDGDEHLPDGGFVAVYNETSWPDALAFNASLWGTHIDRGSGAAEFARIPFMGGACERAGVALVPRGDRAGVDRVLEDLAGSVQAGERVAFGGEGRMSGTDGVIRFKRGAALLAIRSGKPLVPLAMHGGHLLQPWGTLNLRPGTVRLRFGPPLPVDGLGEEGARDLADRAQAAVAGLYAQLGRERAEEAQ